MAIAEIIAASVASFAVIYGVNAWRREYVGKRKIELAEEVLALFYEARDVISYIRNPFSVAGEGSTRNAAPNESPEEKQINDNPMSSLKDIINVKTCSINSMLCGIVTWQNLVRIQLNLSMN